MKSFPRLGKGFRIGVKTMNYIKHLSAIINKFADDEQLTPQHISIYIALFHQWNQYRFQNPLLVSRKEIMHVSKVRSLNTYHKCIRELDKLGYLKYEPNFNPGKGTVINMYKIDTTIVSKSIQVPVPNLIQPCIKIDTADNTGSDTGIIYNKHNKHKLNKTLFVEQAQNENKNLKSNFLIQNANSFSIPDSNHSLNTENSKRKKVPPKKEKAEPIGEVLISIGIPSTINDVLAFFRENNYPELEAQKFYNHFESNGWKVGGKSPMKNWKAAARNWILNSNKFTTTIQTHKPNPYYVNTDKDYSIPL